ncbi:MAG: nitrate respiration regulation response regulator NreC [Aureisphaera sp.]
MIRVLIAEDHRSFIEGIELFFELEDDILIVGTAVSGKETLDLLKRKHVDILITDIRMPDIDGIELTKQVSQGYPGIKIIALTMFDQPEAVLNMIHAGAKGYILKISSLEYLREAIRMVNGGETYYDPSLSFAVDSLPSISVVKKKGVLTKRQLEILELIRQRKSNAEIAEILFIGKHTVATHRRNMIQKLNLSGPNALLSYAKEKRYNFEQ